MERHWSFVNTDINTIVVTFWTYIKRYCDILKPVEKPVDQFGLWYGVRQYQVKLWKNVNGQYVNIPKRISLGPYNRQNIYRRQVARCFICQSEDHHAKNCDLTKCWQCGQLGHKRNVQTSLCTLCGASGHYFFSCLNSYTNRFNSSIRENPSDLPNQDINFTEQEAETEKDPKWRNCYVRHWGENQEYGVCITPGTRRRGKKWIIPVTRRAAPQTATRRQLTKILAPKELQDIHSARTPLQRMRRWTLLLKQQQKIREDLKK